MASDLPSEFDVVVLGTGLPESILAAAFSRNGYKVLHIDRNDFYSGAWASFNTGGIEKWKVRNETAEPGNEKQDNKKSPELKDGERVMLMPGFPADKSKIRVQYHVAEEIDNPEDIVAAESGGDEETSAPPEQLPKTDAEGEGQFDDKKEEQPTETSKEQEQVEKKESKPTQKIWTANEIKDNWRRFNLDLAPKVLYCSGQMVELLIVSDVAKYCEFRTVSRMLTLLNGQLEKVPCSRADVFSSKKVSMLEKRLLMKFLTFCAEHDKYPDQYQDYVGKPFSEFLKFKKLTPNTHHFVYHSIAMATEATTTEQGLKKTQHFLQSLGRYGNTAFLFPLYGSGEIPQGFCRLCAVFGGVYCLQMSATDIIIDQDNKCCAIHTTEGQRIECKHLILGPSYTPETLKDSASDSKISRAILITNKSVLPSENQELSMLHLLLEDDPSRPITILELPPSSMVCPRDSFVVHVTRTGSGDPEADLSPIIQTLFGGSEQTDDKPCILWSLFYSQDDQSDVTPSSSTPSNVYLLPGPGTEIDMDDIVLHARKIWEKICPDEEFLPKPPNPEDIIYVDDAETKVGEGTENAFEDDDEKTKSEEEAPEGTKSEDGDKMTEEEPDVKSEEEGKVNTKSEEVSSDKGKVATGVENKVASDDQVKEQQERGQTELDLCNKLEKTNVR
ncbi:rab proteins geranylgeranyltransferase component A 1-like [Haliotis cracherodii]|uniref:rab proteins geranylgeranyltransferase component A 1-like n=1 Tax=Haliotis cracherodii TaxID=6455 RepID=UPI0039E9454E